MDALLIFAEDAADRCQVGDCPYVGWFAVAASTFEPAETIRACPEHRRSFPRPEYRYRPEMVAAP